MSPILFYGCRTNYQEWSLKITVSYYFTISVSQKSGWTGLVLCLGSDKAKIKVLAGMTSYLAVLGKIGFHLIQIIDRIQFLAAVG